MRHLPSSQATRWLLLLCLAFIGCEQDAAGPLGELGPRYTLEFADSDSLPVTLPSGATIEYGAILFSGSSYDLYLLLRKPDGEPVELHRAGPYLIVSDEVVLKGGQADGSDIALQWHKGRHALIGYGIEGRLLEFAEGPVAARS